MCLIPVHWMRYMQRSKGRIKTWIKYLFRSGREDSSGLLRSLIWAAGDFKSSTKYSEARLENKDKLSHQVVLRVRGRPGIFMVEFELYEAALILKSNTQWKVLRDKLLMQMSTYWCVGVVSEYKVPAVQCQGYIPLTVSTCSIRTNPASRGWSAHTPPAAQFFERSVCLSRIKIIQPHFHFQS